MRWEGGEAPNGVSGTQGSSVEGDGLDRSTQRTRQRGSLASSGTPALERGERSPRPTR